MNVKTDAENSQSESKIADLVRPACQGLECDLPFLFEGLKGLKGDVVAIVKVSQSEGLGCRECKSVST